MKKVAIGGGQGFWGDSPDAAIHMIRNADIQYMGCDYLAELTLSIMAKQQLKDPTKGFVPDFTTRILKEAGKEAWDKHIKICTNAGGMNIIDGIQTFHHTTAHGMVYSQAEVLTVLGGHQALETNFFSDHNVVTSLLLFMQADSQRS